MTASTTTLAFDDVGVGTALPELPIPITTTLIVAGALASRDFTALHHDKSAAQSGGRPDRTTRVSASKRTRRATCLGVRPS